MYKKHAIQLSILFILTLLSILFYFLWNNLSFIPFIVEMRLKTLSAIILSGTALLCGYLPQREIIKWQRLTLCRFI